MWNKGGTFSRGNGSNNVERPTKVLPAHRGAGKVRSLKELFSFLSNGILHSYLLELRNIAINFQLLSPATLARLKKAEVLLGSQRIRRQRSNNSSDPIAGDKGDLDLEYKLLPSDQVAIADDMIALQQFGEEIFCAPQEDILEGEYNTMYP